MGKIMHGDEEYGGGAGNLSDLNDTSISSPSNNQVLTYDSANSEWKNANLPEGGHTMAPTPSVSLTEAQIVSAINAALANNENVASLFGIQNWTNKKSRLFKYNGTVGSTGIGTWKDTAYLDENPPTAADEASWGWWYDDYFKSAELNAVSTDGIKIEFSYDADETIILGGYHLDTDNGYLCIKFANEISDPTNAEIFVEFEIIRNSIS